MSIELKENTVATVHYTGTIPKDGRVFDSSLDRDPLTFLVGHKQMIPGFEREMLGAKVGEKIFVDKAGVSYEATVVMSNGSAATSDTSEKNYEAFHMDKCIKYYILTEALL